MTYIRDLRGFTEDAQKAMAVAPKYWLAWYTIKSLALVGVAAAFAYRLGKDAR